VVGIGQNQPEAGNNAVKGIQVVDDLMLERADRRKRD
jgi:hypothetical protein